jgi:hypothetical protein
VESEKKIYDYFQEPEASKEKSQEDLNKSFFKNMKVKLNKGNTIVSALS